jgi:hypothetical protein
MRRYLKGMLAIGDALMTARIRQRDIAAANAGNEGQFLLENLPG